MRKGVAKSMSVPVGGPRAVPAEVGAPFEEAHAPRQLPLEPRPDLPPDRGPASGSERARFAEALAALAERVLTGEALDPLLQSACSLVADALGVDSAVVLERLPGSDRLVVRAASAGLPGLVGRPVAARPDTQAGSALAALGSTASADARATWPADPFLGELGAASAAATVVRGRGGPLGLLAAYAGRRHAFTAAEVRFLEAAAGFLAAAVVRFRDEAALADRERQLRAVFDGAQDAMLLVAVSGEVEDANAAAARLFGLAREALVGRPAEALSLSPRGEPAARLRLDLVPAGGRVRGEAEVARPGLPPRAVEYEAVAGVAPGRHLAVLRDVTERQELHARLALADRMVSVGTMAAGVAHELNSPLAYVSSNLAFLAERLAELPALLPPGAVAAPALLDLLMQVTEAAADARDGADRMRAIVRDLRALSRPDEGKDAPVELPAVIESCLNVAWAEIERRAQVERELAPVPTVRGTEARLGQVFLNLLVNAAQAIPEGQAERHRIRVSTGLAPDGRVVAEVADTGCGIPPESLPRIFDPFFTTKPPGEGTGLGLSICHSIVTSLGGEILVRSAPGEGSAFRVVLPRGEEDAEEAPPAPARRRARVLVVDDEPLVGIVIQRSLAPEHEVAVVGNGRAALELFERGEAFDLVLCDLLMPEMTGMDLHRALVARHPAAASAMVFLSGGAYTASARQFLEQEPVTCVEKPFDLGAIRALIAERLSAAGRR